VSAVYPDEGEREILRRALSPAAGDSSAFHLRLYKNNYSPVKDSTLGDFTEADFDGYAQQDVIPANWPAPTTAGGVAQSIYGPGVLEFDCNSGSQNVYGYYVVDATGTIVLWAERLPGAPVVASPTTPVLVALVVQLHSEIQP
jgi:hypothetical protein